MRILGLDPGMKRLGFGVVEREDEEVVLLDFGYFLNERPGDVTYNKFLNLAIGFIAEKFPGLLNEYAPDAIAAEIVPVGRLAANSELVVAAITTCKVIAFQFGVPWHDYGANTVKSVIAGHGSATKAKIRSTICSLYSNIAQAHAELKQRQKSDGQKGEGIPFDVFDGVAVATTGLYKLEGQEKRG